MNKNNYKLFFMSLLSLCGLSAAAQNTPVSQMEKLSRGLVVVPAKGGGQLVSWRLLGTEDNDNTSFCVLRNGVDVSGMLTTATCYVDKNGTSSNLYQVVTFDKGQAVDTTETVKPWDKFYTTLHLNRPTGGADYTYSPNDCSVGDVDGDGNYELFVKWDPSNSKDNSQKGKTGNVYIDCYRLDGTQLWRIDLGRNIRAGAHYTQFLVYDFDGDGKAELVCKTAPGSKDGKGAYVSEASDDSRITAADNNKDYRNSSGYVLSGPEYLTVFQGLTGKALHTIFYRPNRGFGNSGEANYSGTWGDTYGNRGDRFLATVAYLDGPDARPSAVMCRGYYTRAYLWAVNFDGKQLSTKWLHASVDDKTVQHWDADGHLTIKRYSSNTSGTNKHNTVYANGNHNLSCADVDGDGKDEIIYGQAAVDNDGQLLYAVGYGHGDAMHLSDLDPDRPGLELFSVHEEGLEPYGWDLHDAATGEVIHTAAGSTDNGRGMSGDIDAKNRGFEFWSSNDRSLRSAHTGEVVNSKGVSVNFRMYWDGDLQDELLDGTKLDKWNGNGTSRLVSFHEYGHSSSCNGTKSTPNLLADLFGDWREEVTFWDSSDGATLNIFTTDEPTQFRVPTLMHDHVYRMGVSWQNVAYNQPPHLGYYLPDRFATKVEPQGETMMEQETVLGDSIHPVVLKLSNCNFLLSKIDSTYLPDGSKLARLDNHFDMKKDFAAKTFVLSGLPDVAGDYTFVVKAAGNVVDGSDTYARVIVHVKDIAAGISTLATDAEGSIEVFDTTGKHVGNQLDNLPRGIYIIKQGATVKKAIGQ